MSKDKKKKKLTIEEVYGGLEYIIDDSKMPSAEEMKNLPETPELDKEMLESARRIAKKWLKEQGELVPCNWN